MRLFAIATACFISCGLARAATIYDDAFDDNARGPQWAALTDNPSALTLAEQNGQLNLISNGTGVATDDALYLSNFRLSTAADFVIRIDYAIAPTPAGNGSFGNALGLVFGVGRDLEGTDSAAIGVGYGNAGAVLMAGTIASRTDDVQTTNRTELPLQASTGTLEVDYAAATDRLTLKRVGSATFTYSLPDGTVRGVWGATDGLLVSFGGRGNGIATVAGNLTLDNFAIASGSVVVPEPTCLTALAGLSAILIGRRRMA